VSRLCGSLRIFARRFSISISERMAAKKEPSKRRGKAVAGANGHAAGEFVPGSAAGPAVFDPEPTAQALRLWWENEDGEKFHLENEEQKTWSCWPEGKVVKLLRSRYVRLKPREGETLSETDQVLLHVMTKRRLDLATSALAGYRAGIHELGSQRMLVKNSPRLVDPLEGEWSTVKALIDGKLDLTNEGGPNQTPYFHGWMRTAIEALYQGGPGNFRPGQCCIFAGPRDSGKSRLQHQVITGLLGGRSADPGPYLFGRTDFNGEMFSAEHLMMEDPASSTATKERVFFGEMLKQLVVNDTQRLHRKREDAMVVAPFFRVTLSINDDPDKMRVLPLLTPDMKDKVNLFLISTSSLPMPTATLDERAAFRTKLAGELPAYAWWLLNTFSIPDALRSVRFGVREWLHPSLAMELFDDTPAAELLTIMDAAQWHGSALWERESESKQRGDLWEGSALDLERLLLDEDSTAHREAERLLKHHKLDRLLSRLKEDQPDRVAQHRTKLQRRWVIAKPD
jgi:hypothetical protein